MAVLGLTLSTPYDGDPGELDISGAGDIGERGSIGERGFEGELVEVENSLI